MDFMPFVAVLRTGMLKIVRIRNDKLCVKQFMDS